MSDEINAKWVKGIVQGELYKRGLTYADLCIRLRLRGVDENERNLRNKIARGTFSASFFLACLQAIGVRELHIDAPAPEHVAFSRHSPNIETRPSSDAKRKPREPKRPPQTPPEVGDFED